MESADFTETKTYISASEGRKVGMKRAIKKRIGVTLAITLLAGAMGAWLGYLTARAVALSLAEIRLERYATRLMEDGEAASSELRTVLAALSASPYKFCSAQEISYFRALIFESEYTKDVGRMRNGRIACSASLGIPRIPAMVPDPVFHQPDGSKVYVNLAPYQERPESVVALQMNESYVVFTPLTRMHLEPAPMHYTETEVDALTQKQGQLSGEQPRFHGPILMSEGQDRIGKSLYATRCSIRYYFCITAYTTVPEALHNDPTHFRLCVAIVSVIGVCIGMLISLAYRRNRSRDKQLRRAIRRDELRMVYQPIVELANRRIVEAEALVRWTDEDGVAVGPDVFVKIAEEFGFVGDLTKLVVRQALRDLGPVLRNHANFRLNINVTASDLADAKFLPMLEGALRNAGVAPERFAIEITESSTARHDAAVEAIRQLRRRGHSVKIDDFGTGYSSLAYLHDLEVDAIKIDRAFTQAIGTEAVTTAILPQILSLATALDLQVIVEGIETEVQAAYFTEAERPVLGQGWLFGRPVGAPEFLQKLAAGGKQEQAVPKDAKKA